jgi:hypothetical protein
LTRKTRHTLETILFFFSPMTILVCFIVVLMLAIQYGEHHTFVQRLNTQGRVTQGTVKYVTPELGWAHVAYTDAEGRERHGELEMHYYAPAAWEDLTTGDTVTLRYLPWVLPGSDRIVLQARYDAVRRYRGYLDPWLVLTLAVCWGALVIQPQLLFIGFAGWDEIEAPEAG